MRQVNKEMELIQHYTIISECLLSLKDLFSFLLLLFLGNSAQTLLSGEWTRLFYDPFHINLSRVFVLPAITDVQIIPFHEIEPYMR